jgi:hypothetical protein
MLTSMARESGIETPTAEDLIRLGRARKGKKLSNADWESLTDLHARIARLKDDRTRLAHKPEHAVDLDTRAVVAAEMRATDSGDAATLPDTLASAAWHLGAFEAATASMRAIMQDRQVGMFKNDVVRQIKIRRVYWGCASRRHCAGRRPPIPNS